MALREARAWGPRERLFERALPRVTDAQLTEWLRAARICDGLVKGLKHPEWPSEPWDGLQKLALMVMQGLR
jgi:DNA polymerase-3 subunit delta